MTPDTWKLIASIGGVLITVVTGPMIWAIRAEAGKIRTEMKLMETQIKLKVAESESRLKLQMTEGESQLKLQMAESESRLKLQMVEMEKRLNERIDTRLVHR